MSLQSRFKQPPAPAPLMAFSGPRLMTLKEATIYLSCGKDFIRQLAERKLVTPVSISTKALTGEATERSHARFDRLDLDRFVEAQKAAVSAGGN